MATVTVTVPATTTIAAKDAPKPAPERPTGFSSIATGADYHGIPRFDDPVKKREWMLEHMAAALRNFARNGYTDGTAGHISVRDPIDPDTFWINPMGHHFGMLTASDMVHVDGEGKVIGGSRKAVNSAGFLIHAAIHEARPDVMAAAHAHSEYAVAWSTFGRPLDNLNQDTCMFHDHQAVYKNFGGIVLEKEEGARIAAVLGPRGKVAHLQNHGLLTCGSTVDEAAHLFNVVERQCRTQFLVESAGIPKTYVSEEEQAYTGGILSDPQVLYTQFQPDYKYEVWKSKGELKLI